MNTATRGPASRHATTTMTVMTTGQGVSTNTVSSPSSTARNRGHHPVEDAGALHRQPVEAPVHPGGHRRVPALLLHREVGDPGFEPRRDLPDGEPVEGERHDGQPQQGAEAGPRPAQARCGSGRVRPPVQVLPLVAQVGVEALHQAQAEEQDEAGHQDRHRALGRRAWASSATRCMIFSRFSARLRNESASGSPASFAASCLARNSSYFKVSFSSRASWSAPSSPHHPRPICTSASTSRTRNAQKNPHRPRAAPQKGPASAAAGFHDHGKRTAD